MIDEESNKLYQIKKLTDSIFLLVSEAGKQSLSDEKIDAISELGKNRQLLIDEFFSHPVAASDSAKVADIIKQVLQVNDQVTNLLEQNKLQLTIEFNQFKSSKKATSAYLKNSGL